MANDFFTNLLTLVGGTKARARNVESDFTKVEQGFDLVAQNVMGMAVESGTGNNFLLTFSPQPAAWPTRGTFVFLATHNNTGAATLQIGALATKPLLANDGSALASNHIVSGELIAVYYNGTDARIVSATKSYVDSLTFAASLPAQGGNAGKFIVTDGVAASWGNATSSLTTNNGTVSAPAINLGDSTTGFFRSALNQISIAVGGVLAATVDAARNLLLSNNLTFTGSGQRITGDFTNGTVANRVHFQTTTTNGNTGVAAMPNGTALTANFKALNSSDPANAAHITMSVSDTIAGLYSNKDGTGSVLPIGMFVAGTERMRLDTSGNVGVGTIADGGVRIHVRDVNAAVKSEGTGGYGSFYASGSSGQSSHYFFGTAGVETGRITTTSAGVMHFANGSGATIRATIDASGNFGVGVTPISTIRSYAVFSGNSTASSEYTSYSYMNAGPTSGSTSKYGGAFVGAAVTGLNHTGTVGGVQGAATIQNAGTTTGRLVAMSGVISTAAAGTVTNLACAFGSSISNAGSSTFSGILASFYAPDLSATSTGANAAYIGEYGAAAGKWNLYMSGTADNYLAGNLGLGATPSSWGAGWKALQVSGGASLWSSGGINAYLSNNIYYDGTNRRYTTTALASEYAQVGGAHTWSSAISGTAGNIASLNTAMTLDASGNLGIGVTPSAWTTLAGGAFQNGGNGAIYSLGTDQVQFSQNVFYNGSDRYVQTRVATKYGQYNGIHAWFNAPSGTAGNAITFTQAMTLDASGNLAIGTASASTKLVVYGGAAGTDTRTTIGNAATALQLGVDSSNNAVISTNTANTLGLYTNSILRMSIDSVGQTTITTSGSIATLNLVDTGASGANLKLSGNGGVTPNKFIRAAGGLFQILNNAYSTVLFEMADSGKIGIGTSAQANVGLWTLVSSTGTTANEYASILSLSANSARGAFNTFGARSDVTAVAGYTGTGGLLGHQAVVTATASTTVASGVAFTGQVNATTGATFTQAVGYQCTFSATGSTIGQSQVFLAADFANNNHVGFYSQVTHATGKYAFYSSGNAASQLNGNLEIASAGNALVIGTGGLGYGTGSGGSVAQATSRATNITSGIDKTNGSFSLFNAAGSATPQSITITNSRVAATDTIIINQRSGTNKYIMLVTAVAAGSFEVTFYTTGGTAVDAPVFNFAVIKAVTA